ncbi:hypothetical protein Tco_0623341 [Tanacetum coccineum]
MVRCTYGRTSSSQTLHRVDFEVEPQDDHGSKGATVSKRSREPLKYRGDSNMAASGVAGVIKEYAHKRRYGYSVSFSKRMSAHILFGGHFTLSLEGGLSGNRDQEKKSNGSCMYICSWKSWIMTSRSITVMGRSIARYDFIIHECAGELGSYIAARVSWEAILQHMIRLFTTEAKYMPLTEELKEDKWLKELFTESRFELSLVVGIAIGALIKVVPIRSSSIGQS